MPLLNTLLLTCASALCLLAAEPVPGAAPDPGRALEEVRAFRHPVLDPTGTSVENQTLQYGQLTLTLGQGTATQVRVGGLVRGLYFVGTGKVQYLSRDPVEPPLIRFNLERNTSLTPRATPEGLVVEDTLREVLLWYGGAPVPALPGAPAAGSTEAFAAHQKAFSRDWGNPGGLMAARSANAANQTVILAELQGMADRFLFLQDGTLARQESFANLRLYTGYYGPTGLTQVALAQRDLGGRRWVDHASAFLLKAVDLDLRASNGTEATLTAKETLLPTMSGQRVLVLNQDPCLYRVLGDAWTRQAIKIDDVRGEDGRPLPFASTDGQVLVQLPGPAEPWKPVKLTFELSGGFLARHQNDDYWELGVHAWFPQPDVGAQAYTVHCRMEVAKPFIPLVPGRVLKEDTTPTHTLVETAIDQPVCFFAVAAGNFQILEVSSPRTRVTARVCGYSGLSKGAAERLGLAVLGYVAFYESFLGKFPFDSLLVREQREVGHGQAPPGTVTITREAFNPHSDAWTEQIATAWINQGVAHEVAHQYWGIQVKMKSLDDQWLTEAFAEYCAALAMRQIRGTGPDRFSKAFAHWASHANAAKASAPIALANRLVSDRPGEGWFRQFLMYDKGALVLGAMHRKLGEDGFPRFLNAFQRTFAWRTATTPDLVALLDQFTGQPWQPFFDRYYWGLDLPAERP